MANASKVFVCHAFEDDTLCASLLSALDAWGVDYWFESGAENTQEAAARTQREIADRPIFLRVCTGALQRAVAVNLQANAFRGLQAADRGKGGRRLINVILSADYVREPFDNATLYIDGVNRPRATWMADLGRALGVRAPVGNRVSRRAVLGYAAAATITVGSTAAAAGLAVTNQKQQQAIKTEPGKIVWQMDNLTAKKSIPPVPTVADGILYVATGELLTAYDSNSRKQLWQRAYDTHDVYGPPGVADGVAYIPVDNYLFAVNASTGARLWSAELPLNDIGDVFTTPVVADGVIYVLSTTGVLDAFSARDGARRWNKPVDVSYFGEVENGNAASGPTVVGGVIYIGSFDHSVYALSTRDGSVRWRFLTRGKIVSTPVVVDGVVYIGSTDAYVYALRASDGRLIWKYRTGADVESTPNVVDGVVYIGSDDEYLYALAADTGKPYWRSPIGDLDPSTGLVQNSGAITCQPAVVGDAVVAIDHSYFIVRSYNRRDGQPRWHYAPPRDIGQNADPIAAGGLILFGCGDQNLYAFGA